MYKYAKSYKPFHSAKHFLSRYMCETHKTNESGQCCGESTRRLPCTRNAVWSNGALRQSKLQPQRPTEFRQYLRYLFISAAAEYHKTTWMCVLKVALGSFEEGHLDGRHTTQHSRYVTEQAAAYAQAGIQRSLQSCKVRPSTTFHSPREATVQKMNAVDQNTRNESKHGALLPKLQLAHWAHTAPCFYSFRIRSTNFHRALKYFHAAENRSNCSTRTRS